MKIKKIFSIIFGVFSSSAVLVLALGLFLGAYFLGYLQGGRKAINQVQEELAKVMSEGLPGLPANQTVRPQNPVVGQANLPSWGGPELWQEINKRRIELGVNPLSQKDELCTIAAIRLNELLELGKLDGHEGFSNLPEKRPDLKWIFEKYDLAEFLLSGADSPQEAVSLWENTLGHKKIVNGGEYVWGCIYASSGTAVAITAF